MSRKRTERTPSVSPQLLPVPPSSPESPGRAALKQSLDETTKKLKAARNELKVAHDANEEATKQLTETQRELIDARRELIDVRRELSQFQRALIARIDQADAEYRERERTARYENDHTARGGQHYFDSPDHTPRGRGDVAAKRRLNF